MTIKPALDERHLGRRFEPRFVLDDLLRARVFRDYFLYEGPGETRIAGDWLVKISVSADSVTVQQNGVAVHKEAADDPFEQVRCLLASLPMSSWTAYGYLGFDLAKFYYRYSRTMGWPLMQLIIPQFETRIPTHAAGILNATGPEEVTEVFTRPHRARRGAAMPELTDSADRQDFYDRVRALTAAIRAGSLQKAILSRCARVPGTLDLLATYSSAARVNHARRSYCFRLDDVGAVGFSPEMFLESNGRGLITTNPLAGTRPRGADAHEDARMRAELFTDAKEVKEHALSVLLARQEIASVCTRRSVRIDDFMDVKQFRCVQHLSSRVSGRLRSGRTVWDALKVLFPAVTVSGIAKQAALQWIGDVEAEPRGIYGGAVGWIDSRGQADLALAIRSAFQYGNTVHLNAGAGIVAESLPEREYAESVSKMNTMLGYIVLTDEQQPQRVSVGVD